MPDAVPTPPQKSARTGAPSAVTVAVPVPQRREYAKVLVCGRLYTTLAWYYGKHLGQSTRSSIANSCNSHALEFRNADTTTLVKNGWAKTSRPTELLPERTYLPSDWLNTVCVAARPPHTPMQIRKGASGRNILWRVEDLDAFSC